MTSDDRHDGTSDPRSLPILDRLDRGETTEALLPELYQELRTLARYYMRSERESHTLQPTALVHEAYLRLLGEHAAQARSRLQFLAAAARAMRQILIEHARARSRKKRGGGRKQVSLHDHALAFEGHDDELLALGDALEELAKQEPRQAQVVELLYFGGLTAAEAAELLGVTSRTVERDWRAARTWLFGRVFAEDTGKIALPRSPGDPATFLSLPARPVDAQDTRSPHPARIGRYEIHEELGRGSGGIVYRASDPDLGRDVAIKVLDEAVSESWGDRLGREARLLAALNHPNIATVFSLEKENGRVFVTMEFVPGHTLEKLLRAGPLPLAFSVEFARQIASGLEAARKQGVVHCDLSPANVKIGPDGLAKILDFGLARGRRQEQPGPGEGFVAGTPGYMSPEQVRGAEPDHRTDVWALGCLLFECLAGQAAFPGTVAAERLAAARDREPEWADLPATLPPRLRALLARCLEKDPESRLASVRFARRELEEELTLLRSPEQSTPAAPSYRQNLPRPSDTFVGREHDTREIARRLAQVRLLTLVGAGGCGKSRLAVEVAWTLTQDLPGGAWFVDLAPCRDREHAERELALALGVREGATEAVLEAVHSSLEGEPALLLFDGCEHLLEPLARLCEELLRVHPQLRILATSRERLRLPGETLFEVKPLSVPRGNNKDEVMASDATRLFLDRARRTRTDLTEEDEDPRAIAEICRHLDGIPLALELAAARTRTLSIPEIAQRLEDRFGLLTSGHRTAQPRHRTLRALIDWSHALLTSTEQIFFRRLSIFAGSFSLAATEAVCADDEIAGWQILDLLTALIEKSLVEVRPQAEGMVRYRMLETVYHYAGERLADSGETATIRQRHLEHVRQWTVHLAPELKGANVSGVLDALEAEHANLIRALESALATDELESGLEIVAALEIFWAVRSGWAEGYRFASALLARAQEDSPARGHVLVFAGSWHLYREELELAEDSYRQARELAERIDDEHLATRAIHNLGGVALRHSSLEEARDWFTRAIEIDRRLGNQHGLAIGLNNLGLVADRMAQHELAADYYRESLVLARELGDERLIPFLLENLGSLLSRSAKPEEARGFLVESVDRHRRIGNRRGLAAALANLGLVECADMNLTGGMTLYREAVETYLSVNDVPGFVRCLRYVGVSLLEHEEFGPAARVLGALQRWGEKHAEPRMWETQGLEEMRPRMAERLGAETVQAAWNAEAADSLEEVAEATLSLMRRFTNSK